MQKHSLDPVTNDTSLYSSKIPTLPGTTRNSESVRKQKDTQRGDSKRLYIFQKNQPQINLVFQGHRRLQSLSIQEQTLEPVTDIKFKSRKNQYSAFRTLDKTDAGDSEVALLKQKCSEQEEIIQQLIKKNEEMEMVKSQVAALRRPSHLQTALFERKSLNRDNIDNFLTSISKVSRTIGSLDEIEQEYQVKQPGDRVEYLAIQKKYLDEKIKNEVLQEKVSALNGMIEILNKNHSHVETSTDSQINQLKMKNIELISKLVKSSDLIFEKSTE